MLKLTITFVVISLSSFSYSQIQAKVAETQASFGRNGYDCSGRGACSFTANKTSGSVLDKSASKITENTIVLQINRTAISSADEVKIAGKLFSEFKINEEAFFVQQEDLLLNTTTVVNLSLDPKYVRIAAGTYPMVIGKDKVEVVFTLRTAN